MKSFALLVVSLFALNLVAADRMSFAVGDNPSLKVVTVSGKIVIKPGSSNDIVVNYVLGDDRLDVTSKQNGDHVIVEAKYPKTSTNIKGGVDFEIELPANASVEAISVSGKVSINGVHGRLDIQNVSGPISISEGSGSVSVNSVSGDIALEQLDSNELKANNVEGRISFRDSALNSGSFKFTTVSGSIDIEVGSDASFTVEGSSVGGSLKSNIAGVEVTKAEYGPMTEMEGSVNGGAARLKVSTVGGKVTVNQ